MLHDTEDLSSLLMEEIKDMCLHEEKLVTIKSLALSVKILANGIMQLNDKKVKPHKYEYGFAVLKKEIDKLNSKLEKVINTFSGVVDKEPLFFDNLNLQEKLIIIERQFIDTEILKAGNKSQAAINLGICRETLRMKILESDKLLALLNGIG